MMINNDNGDDDDDDDNVDNDSHFTGTVSFTGFYKWKTLNNTFTAC